MIADWPDKQAPASVPGLLTRHLHANAAGVYMRHTGPGFLLRWKNTERFSGLLRDVSAMPQGTREGAGWFDMDASGGSRTLTLPLIHEGETAGLVTLVWENRAVGADALGRGDFDILARLLTDLYCVLPTIELLKEREASLLALYQNSQRELDRYRRQVSLALHDEVGQALTAVILQLNMLERSKDPAGGKGQLKNLSRIVDETLAEVRKISRNLRPYLLDRMGLQVAIQAHVQEYEQTTGIAVEYRCNDPERSLPRDVEEVLYRTCQEGLTNVARHARATQAILTLSIRREHVLLQIIDNGSGFAKNVSYGLGLIGMEERSKLLGGRFWICNDKDGGASVNMLLPLTGKAE